MMDCDRIMGSPSRPEALESRADHGRLRAVAAQPGRWSAATLAASATLTAVDWLTTVEWAALLDRLEKAFSIV